MRSTTPVKTIFTGKSATGAGTAIDVRDAKKILLEVIGDASANAVIKIQGAMPDRSPTWGSAASASNPYSYIGFKHMEDRSVVDGGTGLTVGNDSTNLLEVDAEALGWLNVAITTYTAGSVSVRAWLVLDV